MGGPKKNVLRTNLEVVDKGQPGVVLIIARQQDAGLLEVEDCGLEVAEPEVGLAPHQVELDLLGQEVEGLVEAEHRRAVFALVHQTAAHLKAGGKSFKKTTSHRVARKEIVQQFQSHISAIKQICVILLGKKSLKQ